MSLDERGETEIFISYRPKMLLFFFLRFQLASATKKGVNSPLILSSISHSHNIALYLIIE